MNILKVFNAFAILQSYFFVSNAEVKGKVYMQLGYLSKSLIASTYQNCFATAVASPSRLTCATSCLQNTTCRLYCYDGEICSQYSCIISKQGFSSIVSYNEQNNKEMSKCYYPEDGIQYYTDFSVSVSKSSITAEVLSTLKDGYFSYEQTQCVFITDKPEGVYFLFDLREVEIISGIKMYFPYDLDTSSFVYNITVFVSNLPNDITSAPNTFGELQGNLPVGEYTLQFTKDAPVFGRYVTIFKKGTYSMLLACHVEIY